MKDSQHAPAKPDLSGNKRKELLDDLSKTASTLIQGGLKDQSQAVM